MIIHDYVNLYNEITDEDSEHLKRLPYKQFLQTDYWLTISGYVKQRDNNKCVQCSGTRNLHVHHLTYDNIGYEYRTHEDDLITLCKNCHSAIHNVKPKVDKHYESWLKQDLKRSIKPIRRKRRKEEMMSIKAIKDQLAEDLRKYINDHPSLPSNLSHEGILRQIKTMRLEALLKVAIRLGLNIWFVIK